jgi:signal transduction histidine kinase
MGEMIGMIAHQWRQPLNNLSLSNQLLISRYENGQLNEKTVAIFKENSKKQIVHMSKTIDDFRNFFKSENKIKKFSVNEIINDILNITIGIYERYAIHLNYTPTQEITAEGFPNELAQAILNIINNAKDALIEKKIANKFINLQLDKSGDTISISVEDNAGGISKDIAEKIFDPYFSTKEEKNGTGLGLYMTKMIIVDKLRGKIDFQNTKEGVRFEITFKEKYNATK